LYSAFFLPAPLNPGQQRKKKPPRVFTRGGLFQAGFDHEMHGRLNRLLLKKSGE
jgi:hypothetical protein